MVPLRWDPEIQGPRALAPGLYNLIMLGYHLLIFTLLLLTGDDLVIVYSAYNARVPTSQSRWTPRCKYMWKYYYFVDFAWSLFCEIIPSFRNQMKRLEQRKLYQSSLRKRISLNRDGCVNKHNGRE